MAFEQLAYIIGGAFAGSTQVQVQAVQANGTVVRVYEAIFGEYGGFNELGNATLTANEATVTLNRPLVENEAIFACVITFGEKVGGASQVGPAADLPTGWKLPDTVQVGEDTMTAAEYTEETGIELPALYDPASINHTPVFPNSGIEKLTEIGFDLTEKINATGSSVLTVDNVKNCSLGYNIKFDTDAASNIHSKTYFAGGVKTIRVTDTNNALRFCEKTYTVTVPTPPAPTSEISNESYTFSWAGALLGIEVFADSAFALEMKIDGVTVGPYVDMSFKGANRWQRGYGVPQGPGTYTVTVRRKATPGDFKTFQAVLS
ncbi:hypothetical protein [Runella salmonicolor]|uniref:Uncharacterized protein n=1 Tax=Runella salmonicolor TaxID=2950278 RepID=A0ABT1FSR1_9BACT|nr:hypothetical protein [Runella salmonicolor]MCP1384804.1 hypothetical protein [Runella salmonicolor]